MGSGNRRDWVIGSIAKLAEWLSVRLTKITDAIIAEHTIFLTLFDQIESVLPLLKSPAEIGALAGLVAGLLGDHAQAETDFAFVALDDALFHKNRLETMLREHHELDDRLLRVRRAGTCK